MAGLDCHESARSNGTIGLLFPAIVIAGRLLQGFSAGAEQGGVSVYLAEFAPSGRLGFYVSWLLR
jgi:MHS family citrate/tricarballylate:H+ symporter-like MFS transporter